MKQKLLDASIFWLGVSLMSVVLLSVLAVLFTVCAFAFTEGDWQYAGKLMVFWFVVLVPFLVSCILSFLAILACGGWKKLQSEWGREAIDGK